MAYFKNTLFLSCILLLAFSCKESNLKESTLTVSGNCEMCKATIENSLKVDGVYSAIWDVESKKMSLSFDSTLISLPTIATYVALSGYDNELVQAKDSVYSQLPKCCQYTRSN